MFHEYSSGGAGARVVHDAEVDERVDVTARNTSRAFFERRSTWWCSMSFGRPAIGRRSGRRCSSRSRGGAGARRCAPSRPEMPVMTTFLRSQKTCGALAEAEVDHRLDAILHRLDLVVEESSSSSDRR